MCGKYFFLYYTLCPIKRTQDKVYLKSTPFFEVSDFIIIKEDAYELYAK